MAATDQDLEQLYTDVIDGCLVLTPNHRTAFQLLDGYGRYRRDNGLPAVCPSPRIHPVDIWIRRESEAIMQAGLDSLPRVSILESGHEALIWQRIIRSSRIGRELLNQPATARAVQDAWSLVHLWEIRGDELAAFTRFKGGQGFDDLCAYLDWAEAFDQFCRQHRLITLVQLLDKFIPLVGTGEIALPPQVILAGFDQPPPRYGRLLDAVRQGAAASRDFTYQARQPVISGRRLNDVEGEVDAAARWAKGIQQADPAARIGIIVPDLHRHRAAIQRIFSRHFDPLESINLRARQHQPFSISVTGSLGRKALIHAALQCLRRNSHASGTPDTLAFLRSPFLAGAREEETARAKLEQKIRRDNYPFVTNADLRFLAAMDDQAHHCPVLARLLIDFEQQRPPGASSRKAGTAQWCDMFERQLQNLGWPGDRDLTPEENRQLSLWHACLADFKRLSLTFGELDLEDAIELLAQLAANTSTGRAGAEAAVQILTPVEAQGMQFTHCWMTGLSEQQWPPRTSPSPFIPFALQKSKGIPEADTALYHAAMTALVEGFRAGTRDEMVLSYAAMDEDIEQHPAAVFNALRQGGPAEETTTSASHWRHPLADAIHAPEPVLFEDTGHIPLLDEETVSGGSSLVADQADCPFRSFARHRLNAQDREALVPGLSARAAGSLLHLVLDMFWQRMQSQATLRKTDSKALAILVNEVIDEAIRQTARRYRHIMTTAYCQLEKTRLRELLLQWLEEEEKRGSFTVLAREFDTAWEHAGMTLKLRIDRIDRLEDDSLVLVDYKSSQHTAVDWEDERPANPQLMLYCLALEQHRESARLPALPECGPVNGAFFAQVNIEKTVYRGLAGPPGVYPDSAVTELQGKYNGLADDATWTGLKARWESSLSALAEEFLAGRLAVAPKNADSCRYCQVRPVCRIGEVIDP